MAVLFTFLVFQGFILTCRTMDPGDFWENMKCYERYEPENCDFDSLPSVTVEDYERCAPALLPISVRNYYLARTGRGVTYVENQKAFQRLRISPRMLQDISNNRLDVSVLGQRVSFPVGIAPAALQAFADPEGEKATARAAAAMNTIMILSSYSSFRLEEVAASVQGTRANLWLQIYIFGNRTLTLDLVKRAERSGYKAIVLTVDSNVSPKKSCAVQVDPVIQNYPFVNAGSHETFGSASLGLITPKEIKWLKSITHLPIVAKGVLSASDAVKAIDAGVSAVIVSNHGGRQLDSAPASIDALPDIVRAVNRQSPGKEVYLDSGIRNGFDVFKALARGAKMVFVGRPVLWGLTMEGEQGVRNVLAILREQFNSTMLSAGASDPSKIKSENVLPSQYCQIS